MTAIIISILAALGIGGGVMLASSGGGGGSSGGAVVDTINPGGGGSGGGGGIVNPNLPSISPFIQNALTNPASISSPGNLQNNTFTIGMSAFAPLPIGEYYPNQAGNTNSFIIMGTESYWSGGPNTLTSWDSYNANFGTKANVYDSFNLSNISDATKPKVDFYQGTNQSQEFYAPRELSISAEPNISGHIHATWNFNSTLALGGRKMGLQYSDFGYYKWWAGLSNITSADPSGYSRTSVANQWGGKQFYMYEVSRLFTDQDRANRYKNNNYMATFTGNVIGIQKMEHYNCGRENTLNDLTGDITLTLNFNQAYHYGVVSGSITNIQVSNQPWYDLTLSGTVKANSGDNNFIKINSVTYNPEQTSSVNINQLNGENVRYLTESNNFGSGAIIKGDSIAQDEVVGGISFVGKNSNYYFIFTHLAFGTKFQQ